jgi:hypothetical protein
MSCAKKVPLARFVVVDFALAVSCVSDFGDTGRLGSYIVFGCAFNSRASYASPSSSTASTT